MYIRDRVWNFIKSSDSVLSFVLSLGLGQGKAIPKICPDPAQTTKIAFLAQKLVKNLVGSNLKYPVAKKVTSQNLNQARQ